MLTDAVGRASDLVQQAKKPILLAGAHLRAHGAIDAFRELAEALGCAVAVMPNAKGFFPEDHPQYVGIYWGEVSSPQCQAIVDWADLIVAAGAVFNDYTTVGWSAQPARGRLISAEPRKVQLPDAEYHGVALAEFLSDLAKKVQANAATLTQYHRLHRTTSAPVAAADVDAHDPAEPGRAVAADRARPRLEDHAAGGNRYSWLNGMYTRLPGGARFEIEMQYGSIGWSVPATLRLRDGPGADRRLVSVIGDGSFQLTAQEVSNMIRHGQEILIFLVNNRGYVIESAIHDGPYNYYKNWDYAGLIDVFNAGDGGGLGLTASTAGRTGRGDQQGTRPQGRPGPDRMPNPQRRRQP